MKIVGFDPGNEAGLALVKDGVLAHLEVIKAPPKKKVDLNNFGALHNCVQILTQRAAYFGPVDVLVVEYPINYPGSKIPPGSLQNLNTMIGIALGAFEYEKAVIYTAPEWTGRVAKDLRQRHFLKGLDLDTLAKRHHINKSTLHNAVDAWHLAEYCRKGHL